MGMTRGDRRALHRTVNVRTEGRSMLEEGVETNFSKPPLTGFRMAGTESQESKSAMSVKLHGVF